MYGGIFNPGNLPDNDTRDRDYKPSQKEKSEAEKDERAHLDLVPEDTLDYRIKHLRTDMATTTAKKNIAFYRNQYQPKHPLAGDVYSDKNDLSSFLTSDLARNLNPILRIPYAFRKEWIVQQPKPPAKSLSSFHTIERAAKDWQNDHFIEIQHAVELVLRFSLQQNNSSISDIRLGEVELLASYLNDSRNLFCIATKNNQDKKRIPLLAYMDDKSVIRPYLDCKVKEMPPVTVEAEVKSLVRDMCREASHYSILTNLVGREVAVVFGWFDLIDG